MQIILRFLSICFIFSTLLLAENNQSVAENNQSTSFKPKDKAVIQKQILADIATIEYEIKDNVWRNKFLNFLNYKELDRILKKYKNELKNTDPKEYKRISDLEKKIETTKSQKELLKEYEKSPFSGIIKEPNLGEIQRVNNPFAILFGYSSIKHLVSLKNDYKDKIRSLDELIIKLKEKKELYKKLFYIDNSEANGKNLDKIDYEISEFESAKEVGVTSFDVYEEKIDEQINTIKNDIKIQTKRTINIGIVILVIILISFMFKYAAKKYIVDDENFYLINKIINVLNFTIIGLILLFTYIENMSYLITVFGFASAGLAIAMKDMFMSMLGWCVIVFSGTFKVGDRIRVIGKNERYIGDIIDISLLKITIFEDISYTTWKINRRAGRIIFIPNNYIFSELILNYTHNGMKTIWDGIDVLLTFDSNHKKAMYIIKNIVLKYSKGYTDIAKKQMRKLRSQYNVKNQSVEPRIYSFFEPCGIQISVWYMTNAYASLSLRSNISDEILEALRNEDDIKIAYPTQFIYTRQSNEIKNEKTNQTTDIML